MQQLIPDPKRWAALALLCAAQFIVILDTSIIGVALPAMQRDLGFSASGLSWIFNAYVIAFGGLLLLGGRLGDLLGARRIFTSGFAILTSASLLAGLAHSQEMLLAGRALQGVGAALIAPSALTIVMRLFGHDGAELGKAFGFWGAAAAAGGSAGVFLGGVITEWMTWPWTFLINVPLGLLVLALIPAVLRKSPRSIGAVDWFGAISVTGALVSLVYAIVTIESASLGSVPILPISAGLFAVFLISQFVRREPLLPLGIFKTKNLAAGNFVMALLGAAWIPLWFFLNLYLQQILGLSALASGLALLPMTITIMIVMVGFSGKLIGRFGVKSNLVLGLLLMAGALLMFANLPLNGAYVTHVLPASLLAALGMALAYIPTTMTGMAGARPEETGLASGLINTTYQIGSAIGLAMMVALATSGTGHTTEGVLAGFQAAFLGAGVAAGLAAFAALVFVGSTGPQREVPVG
ncbi:putative MFS-type transporter EfpA [Janthinobacterium sp. KBS0711]|uniref:MFS transporter n=1 Tax=Janthinobacterium sp. KBS0711 TaxID=1649647 RepID=UPI00062798CC|nr:MFS transporter [Janthinobacterium sp. KBS0711]KKO61042.1 putative MFS-type transporter EfpA [Janthinobacterium sp. KBS0711]